jgi:hypothetical protein
MRKSLNSNQREFLEYIQKHHKGIGWYGTIDGMLRMGSYDDCGMILTVLRIFQKLKVEQPPQMIKKFGLPTKYLK